MDWGKLVFGTRVDTHCYIKHVWKDGAWDEGEMVEEPYVKMHVLANVFHYGQAIFEGQKVFHCKDGKVRIFNDKMNHIRMSRGAERMGMPTMSLEMFQSALTRVTLANLDFVPPYGSGASLYLRPFMVGSGPQLGLGASSEFTFIVVVAPVGPYYGSAVPAIVVEDYDRAAPNGVGQVGRGDEVSYFFGVQIYPHLCGMFTIWADISMILKNDHKVSSTNTVHTYVT